MKIHVLLFIMLSFSSNAYCQLWKQYSDSAKVYTDQKNIEMAITYYERAKAAMPNDSIWTNSNAGICTKIADLYSDLGDFEKAEPLYLESKKIFEKVFGKENLEYASSCNDLAILYTDLGKYALAEPLFIETKQIREKILGKEHAQYAASCNNLGNVYRNMDQYEKAESLYLEAKNIRERTVGKTHPSYASCCDNLGNLYMDMGQFDKAEPLVIEAKNIREKSFGKVHAAYATSCNNLANFYNDIGQFAKAEPLYAEAKKIWEKLFSKFHPNYASTCYNLAVLYKKMGEYVQAEQLFLEAKFLREKMLGKENPTYALSCGSLANLYADIGQYGKAELLQLEAKQIWENVFGKEHSRYAASCDNLAGLYNDMGQYKKAEPLYLEAKKIREKILGKDHPEYATNCFNLANLYYDLGQYEQAELLYLEAKRVSEKALGKEHPDCASNCDALANLYSVTGQYDKAEPLYLEAKQIREKALGKEHPDYAKSYRNLANLYWDLKEYEKAHENYIEAFSLQNNIIRKVFQFTSESEKQLYLIKIAALVKYILSFNTTAYSSARQGASYDVSITSRNLILSSLQQLRQAINNTNDSTIKNKYSDWINSREQIAFWKTNSIADRPVYLKDLEERSNSLEKELTRLSADFRNDQSVIDISWKNIQQSLRADEAAIEFAEFNYFNGKRWTDSIYYIALLIKKDLPEPELIRLFEKKELDFLFNFKKTSPGQQKLNSLYSFQKQTNNKSGENSLSNIIWKPLEGNLNGIKTIYYAPAGTLYKIAFAALPLDNNVVLSDKYKLVQLTSTASVSDKSSASISSSDKILLYGGVQYDADSASIKKAALPYSKNDLATRSLPDDLLKEGSGDFTYLKGTEQEVSQVEMLAAQYKYNVTVAKGMIATEESIKSLTGNCSPVLLHFATHGFFFPDPKTEKKDERAGGAIVFKQSDNPLIRSGLALAGANNAWRGKPVMGVEDGILTSYEVSNMYLPNTKLAVLSACETGLGDIQGSEGVYGLQRAFKMAGVQYLLMSLWKVDDKATAEFMQEFYRGLFNKQTIEEAFNNAQSILKDKYRNDPYKWAAWILVR